MTGRDSTPDENLGLEQFQLVGPPPVLFEGWHLPRKQTVRRAQWSLPLKTLVEGFPPGQPIKYLGLPGPDLLDVRELVNAVCVTEDRRLAFLGFVKSALAGEPGHEMLNTSLSTVLRSPLVMAESQVLPDDIYYLADRSSVAWGQAEQLGTYDFVNFDLCEPALGRDHSTPRNIYGALHGVFDLQSRRSEPWLLALTSRIDRLSFSGSTFARLFSLFDKNRRECETFARSVTRIDPSLAEADEAGVELVDGMIFFRLAALLACKWILDLCSQTRCKLRLINSAGYRVYERADLDMLSLTLRVEPQYDLRPDSAGLARPMVGLDECALASAIADRLLRLTDLDEFLVQNPGMQDDALRQSVDLMVAASYPRDAYLDWLKERGVEIAAML